MEGKKASQFQQDQPVTSRREEMRARSTSVSWPAAVRIIAALTGGLILRLWMMHAFPQASGDALIYGNIAKNILHHGHFALSDQSGVPHETLIRLPGYPFFLAAVFAIFGADNYTAVAWLQFALELSSCLLLADFVRRVWSERAGLNALWLAAMCPFTAVYTSAPLTESLTFDVICLALWAIERYTSQRYTTAGSSNRGRISAAAAFTAAISVAALLRPDGALLALAFWPAMLFSRTRKAIPTALLCGLISILPFVAWTARNWSTFHVIEPLAPRYATDPGEDPHLGWQHWVKSWCLDFTCTNQIYWNMPDGSVEFTDLPAHAFDSAAQRLQTEAIFNDYNQNQGQQITPEIDAQFQSIADQRTAAHPIRAHLLLPLGRLADMLFRPRVENLTIDLRWWEYWNHRPETRFSYAYAALNLILLSLGVAGLLYRPALWKSIAAYIILRCLLLSTIEAPETRYTLEFFPFVFALGGIAMQQLFKRKIQKS